MAALATMTGVSRCLRLLAGCVAYRGRKASAPKVCSTGTYFGCQAGSGKALAKIHRRPSPATPRTWRTRVPRHFQKWDQFKLMLNVAHPKGGDTFAAAADGGLLSRRRPKRGILKLSGRHPCLTWEKRSRGQLTIVPQGARNRQSEDHVSHLIDRR